MGISYARAMRELNVASILAPHRIVGNASTYSSLLPEPVNPQVPEIFLLTSSAHDFLHKSLPSITLLFIT